MIGNWDQRVRREYKVKTSFSVPLRGLLKKLEIIIQCLEQGYCRRLTKKGEEREPLGPGRRALQLTGRQTELSL